MKTLREGQKVQIEFEMNDTKKGHIVCSIAKIEPDRLFLNYSSKISKYFEYLEEGTEVRAFIFTGAHIQVIKSIILSAPYEDEFEIEYPDDYKTIQRRAYVRESVNYSVIIETDNNTIQAKSVDMGGGGFRFIPNEAIELDSKITAWIDLNDGKESLKTKGIVTKKPHFKDEEYLLQFTDIEDNDRNRIIQACIQKQVKGMRDN